MLIYIDDKTLVDVVREDGYADLYTFRASRVEDLAFLAGSFCSEPIAVQDENFPFISHVPSFGSPLSLWGAQWGQIETVDRLTPPPVCFEYSYAYESEDGTLNGEYGFCWPNEVEVVRERLRTMEYNQPINGDVDFLPRFTLSRELLF